MPHATPTREVIANAVLLAGRAPSVHNSQPWRWVFADATLRLYVDPSRRVHHTDRTGREAIISCGAVLHHLCVAMVAAGWQAHVDRFPHPRNENQLASITFTPLDVVSDVQRRRADAILQRRTDRLPLDYPTYWASFEPVLCGSIADTAATLDVLPDEARAELTEASRLTELLRQDDLTYQAELQWWTAPFVAYEGMPPETLASSQESYRVDVAREFPSRGVGDRRAVIAEDRSKILVLSTESDSPADVLGCGEALSTVLLECTMAGMATCPLTHLIELDDSRDVVRTLIDEQREPQVLIRAGIAPPIEDLPAATPRRPLEAVLEFG
ncbi:hypothetical protein GCM10009641_63530 [Mycobacterium cookii]|uniref:NAD(P)H nitroreductase acg n=1 Tax=Mycobacterium cookii TaxID=1775 RepID=A0A7I7KVR2_9MYCO|nr:NAD(P)H nitroreductase [Mycobacterium cookii]MCV7329989.1 NAD(P)H nitroreductase [Mycobacterium cookii]BBX45917.1 hypothetical protein MCOO_19320 [Mycobacterium cookii]